MVPWVVVCNNYGIIDLSEQADTKPLEAAMLANINHNGPVEVRELGKAGQGIVWTVQPANFDSVVKMINANGGPSAWRVTAL